jgi:DNA invertase Pin-like site-specific DNA recombinase
MRKKMTHKLTKEQKAEIVKLVEDGFSPSDVAAKFKVSRATVYNVWRANRDAKETDNRGLP